MSFKKNLLKKLEIKNTTTKVLDSFGPPGSGRRIDKETMRRLLEMSTYQYRRVRDLDLYIAKEDTGPDRILVLDNELAIYKTTIEDVALRKSPKVKEVMSIKNIIKIMNDKDVVTSRKEDSLKTIEKACIDRLDLSFDVSDIQEIETDGVISLEKDYMDGVVESLSLFAEILGYEPPIKDFRVSQHLIFGALVLTESGESMYGPIIIYSIIHNILKLIEEQIKTNDKANLKRFQNIVSGKEKTPTEGSEVFRYLRKSVVKQYL
ncbi:hypothetical protein ACFL7E_00140 [Thermodesulfobacteriota bacterium]